jgi:hypothetical protein
MAGGAKAPKNLCLDFTALSQDFHNLVFKSSGTMATTNGKIKTYTVTGQALTIYGEGLISGSAYVAPDSPLLFATYSGKFGTELGFYDLKYNLEDEDGQVRYRIELSTNAIITSQDNVVKMDCETFGPDI